MPKSEQINGPMDYPQWITYTNNDGSGTVVYIKPKNPHVMYKGNLNPDWAAFEKEISSLHYCAMDIVHPLTLNVKHLVFSGKGKFATARIKRDNELTLEDDDSEQGIILNVIYDCDWCDMSDDSINATIDYLNRNYIIKRRVKNG